MKKLLFTIAATLVATASANEGVPQCADFTVKAAVQKNFKTYGASTNSCGIKPLNIGEFLETFLVCVSDETESADAEKLIDADDSLTYILGWTAPSNSGSSIVIADKSTCKEKMSVVVSSEE